MGTCDSTATISPQTECRSLVNPTQRVASGVVCSHQNTLRSPLHAPMPTLCHRLARPGRLRSGVHRPCRPRSPDLHRWPQARVHHPGRCQGHETPFSPHTDTKRLICRGSHRRLAHCHLSQPHHPTHRRLPRRARHIQQSRVRSADALLRRLALVRFRDQVPTLWKVAHGAGLTTASVGWPVSVGATDVDWLIPEFWRSADPSAASNPADRLLLAALSRPDNLIQQLEPAAGPYMMGNDTSIAGDETKTRYALEILRRDKPAFMTIHLSSLDDAQHAHAPFSPEADRTLESIDGMVARLRRGRLRQRTHNGARRRLRSRIHEHIAPGQSLHSVSPGRAYPGHSQIRKPTLR